MTGVRLISTRTILVVVVLALIATVSPRGLIAARSPFGSTQPSPPTQSPSSLFNNRQPDEDERRPASRKIAGDLAARLAQDDVDRGARTAVDQEPGIPVIVETAGTPAEELIDSVSKRSGKGGAFPGRRAHRFKTLDGFAAYLTATEIHQVAAREDVTYISPDRRTQGLSSPPDVELDEETGADNAKDVDPYLRGTGITIAFLDSGIDWNNVLMRDAYGNTRVRVVVDAVTGESTFSDVFGHGTAVAGVAAGRTYRGISGLASDASLISVRVLGADGEGSVSDAIRGLDWCVSNRQTYNIRVINMSIGASSSESFTNDPLCRAAERAVSAGITVVTSAGNYGLDAAGNKVYGGITSPGNDPLVITVGAANTRGTARRSDDVVNRFSSRGPTLGYKWTSSGRKQYDFVTKPDLVAPGNNVVTARAANARLVRDYPQLAYPDSTALMQISGTSIASGVVAGAATLLLDANPGLSPGLVKAILQYTAQPISGADVCEQGAGLINVDAAVRLAKGLRNPSSLYPGSWLAYNGSLPTLQTSISGESCGISGTIFSDANHVWAGKELFLRYQMIYEPGALWYGGKITIGGSTVWSGTLFTRGVVNITQCVANNGGQLAPTLIDGGYTPPNGVSVIQGVVDAGGIVLSEGWTLDGSRTLADGIVLSEGITIREGIVLSEGVPGSSTIPVMIVDGEP